MERNGYVMRTETHLEMAKRHVREAEAIVARQRKLVEQLRRDGHDLVEAERLLRNFEESLEAHRQGLAHMRRARKPS